MTYTDYNNHRESLDCNSYNDYEERSLRVQSFLVLTASQPLRAGLIHGQAFAGNEGVLRTPQRTKRQTEHRQPWSVSCFSRLFHSKHDQAFFLSKQLSGLISILHAWWQSTGKLSSAVPESNNKKFMNWSWQPTSKMTRAMGQVWFIVGERKLLGNGWIGD